MKRLIILITVLAMLFTSIASTVSAEETEFKGLFWDFEDGLESTFPGVSATTICSVDSLHGTSLKYGGNTNIDFNSVLTEGVYHISYDLKVDATKRFILRAVSSEANDHYLMRAVEHEEKDSDGNTVTYDDGYIYLSTNTSTKAWSFTSAGGHNTKWNRYDMIVDMTNKNITYYVNGTEITSTSVAFADFKGLYILQERTGNTYLDNFKVEEYDETQLSDGRITTPDWLIDVDGSVNAVFSEAFDKTTVSAGDIKVYRLGNSPLEFEETEIGFSVSEQTAISMKFDFDELEAGTNYKIEFENAKSIFGKSYNLNEVYFSTKGGMSEKAFINDDFTYMKKPSGVTPNENGTWMWANSIPNGSSDESKKWSKGGKTGNIFPCYINSETKETAVEFISEVTSSGNDKAHKAFASPARTDSARNKIVIEYKLYFDTVPGGFVAELIDSEKISTTFMKITSGGIYTVGKIWNAASEKKVHDLILDEWFTYKAEIDLNTGYYNVYINDEKVTDEPILLSSSNYSGGHATNFARVKFTQYNVYGANDENNTLENAAHTYLAYVNVTEFVDVPSVAQIFFTGIDGNIYYPDGIIPAEVNKMTVRFSGDINGETLEDAVVLTNTDISETIIPEMKFYNAEPCCELLLPDLLAGNSFYEIEISGSVADKMGINIEPVSGTVQTAGGILEISNLKTDVDGANIKVSADMVHTDTEQNAFHLIFAGYKGNYMKGFAFAPVYLDELERYGNKEVTFVADNIDEFDYIKSFVWEDFETLVPLCEFNMISFGVVESQE